MIDAAKERGIDQILRKYDPMGLIKMGAPNNEYITELQFLAQNLEPGMSQGRVRAMVIDHFREEFDQLTFFQRRRLSKIAKEIFELIEL